MNLEHFKELLNPLPGNHYLYISTQEDEITKLLASLMLKVDGELNSIYYNDENLNFSQPFRAIPRDNDIVIIKDVFSQHQNKEMLLKLSYLSLANTANVIILEKKGSLDIESTKELLENFEFRSPNDIDILEGYDLIVGKKMHMWGAGL